MTKEEILVELGSYNDLVNYKPTGLKEVLQAMQQYADQECAEKDKRIKELEEGLREMIRCTAVFKENMLTADVTLDEHCNAVEKAKQLLNK